jgi:hypothetical protein
VSRDHAHSKLGRRLAGPDRTNEDLLYTCTEKPIHHLLVQFTSLGNEVYTRYGICQHPSQEGSVYKRKDGRWVASIILENGKRKSVYCKTQQEAIKADKKANRDKDQGLLLPGEDQTLDTFLTIWLKDTIKSKVRERTWVRYRELMELHVLPVLGKFQLQNLSPQHLQKTL